MARTRPKEKVLFLETRLDEKPNSPRGQIEFMKSFFKVYDHVELIPREVHTRSDLESALDYGRDDGDVIAIHIVGHGEAYGDQCDLILDMKEKVDLTQASNRGLFRDLDESILFFSCCQIGNNAGVMREILDTSKAQAVFSYTDDLNDEQAFLVESLFYHLFLGHVPEPYEKMSLYTIYEKLKFAMDYLLVDRHPEPLAHPLLVADFAPASDA
jgi:hypothetical protein